MSFTCPRCGAVSHNPHDEAEGYCGACHDWTETHSRWQLWRRFLTEPCQYPEARALYAMAIATWRRQPGEDL